MRYLSQTITFLQQETTEIKKLNQGCMGDIPQVQAGADIKKLLAQTPSPIVRLSNNSDDMYATHLEHGHPPKSMKE